MRASCASVIARATKDIDLTLPHHLTTSSPSPADQIRDMLQDAAAEDLGDRFVFVVAKAKEQLVAPPYGGVRYPVTATLDERHFSNFELDVTFAAPISAPSEQLIGHDWLDFVGIAPPRVSVLPVPQQFAEKAHAYSLPHIGQENSRVKDLADMILYLETRPPDRDAVAQAVRAVFELRNTHPIPATLPEPPATWDAVFKSIAAHCALSAADLATAYHILSVYWSSLSLP